MGRSTGTGSPLSFRCAKCKVGRNWDSYRRKDTHKGMNIRVTGRVRPRGKVGNPVRKGDMSVEYECLDCRHKGWTTHITAWRLFMKDRDWKIDHPRHAMYDVK